MKKGYIRLLIFSMILIFIMLLNSFSSNFLLGYRVILFLAIILVIFYAYFVLEKNKNIYFNDLLYEIILFALSFFILYYLLGLVVGLARTPNYYTFRGLVNFIIPIVITCILREILRYNMLRKAEGSIICTIVVVLVILLLDITNNTYYYTFDSNYHIFKYIALVFLPALSKNISYSYITKHYGYKVVIIFDLIFSLYLYLLPLVPNPNEYMASIIYLLVPILFALRIVRFVSRKKDDLIPSNYHKKRFKGILVPMTIIIIMVYFYSGYFKYYAIAIASNSMKTTLSKGDIVIVDQKYPYEKYKIGDIIAVKYDKVIIVHRIVKEVKINNKYIYYTKGDANPNMDNYYIEEDMVIGKVDFMIPCIGYPTVWFNKE